MLNVALPELQRVMDYARLKMSYDGIDEHRIFPSIICTNGTAGMIPQNCCESSRMARFRSKHPLKARAVCSMRT